MQHDEEESEPLPSVEESELDKLCKPDDYMKYYFVADTIKPIKIGDEIHIVKSKEQDTLKLTEMLESLKPKKEKEETEDVILPEYEKYEMVEEKEPERINYGVFLHAVNIIDYNETKLLKDGCLTNCIDKRIHTISIKGSPYIKETLEFEDLSPYKDIYPVYKIEWFLSLEINDSQIYEIIPIQKGKKCIIPYEALGKYIFCKAYRRIYANAPFYQTDELVENHKKSVFDPHTLCAKPFKLKNTPEYSEVYSINNKGPVLIPLDLALQILLHFCINNYSTQVLLQDPFDNLFDSSSISDAHLTVTSTNSDLNSIIDDAVDQLPVVAILTINLNQLCLSLCTTEQKEIDKTRENEKSPNYETRNGEQWNFSSSKEHSNSNSLNHVIPKKKDDLKASYFTSDTNNKKFNLYEVDFRLSGNNEFIILSIGDNIQKLFQSAKIKMSRMKPIDSNISMYQFWIILIAFKAAHTYKKVFTSQWKRVYEKGNIFFIQRLLHHYLTMSLTKNISETLPLQKINTIFNEK